jgi:hypothetical protein
MVSNTPWDVGARGTNQKMERTQAILTTMKLSLQEETGMLLSAAYKWLRKQLRIQNVDTVASNMGGRDDWKVEEKLSHRPSTFSSYSFGLKISWHQKASQAYLHKTQHQSIQMLLTPEW